MIKRISLVVAILLILVGCSQLTAKDVLLDNVRMMEQDLDKAEWKAAKKNTEELQQLYEKNRWKIQLLGDEGEYEKLYDSINRLMVAVKEKDAMESKLELATVKSLIMDIYSL